MKMLLAMTVQQPDPSELVHSCIPVSILCTILLIPCVYAAGQKLVLISRLLQLGEARVSAFGQPWLMHVSSCRRHMPAMVTHCDLHTVAVEALLQVLVGSCGLSKQYVLDLYNCLWVLFGDHCLAHKKTAGQSSACTG